MLENILEPIFIFLENTIFMDWHTFLNQNLALLPSVLIYLFVFVISICVGSFLNVVVHRLPLIFEQNLEHFLANINQEEQEQQEGQNKPNQQPLEKIETQNITLSHPASHCPICEQKIKWYDNIPLLSWLILKAKCRHCHTPISMQYFVVELSAGLLGLLIAFAYLNIWQIPQTPQILKTQAMLDFGALFFLLLFIWQLLSITLLDAKTQLMPNELTLPFLATGLLFAAYQQSYEIQWFYKMNAAESVFAAMSAFFLLKIFAYVFKKLRNIDGLGGGDVYLFAGFAAWFGLKIACLALFSAAALGLIFMILAVIFKWRNFEESIAFGPFLSLGLLSVLLFSRSVIF